MWGVESLVVFVLCVCFAIQWKINFKTVYASYLYVKEEKNPGSQEVWALPPILAASTSNIDHLSFFFP